MKTKVIMYTDGACKGNPGPGGWGVYLKYGNHEKELFGGEANTTNNRMEILAVINGLLELNRPCDVVVYLDSQYVRNGVTSWMQKWKKKNWKGSTGEPVKNQDLWQCLDKVLRDTMHSIEWIWVKGHSGVHGNEKADALANRGVCSVK